MDLLVNATALHKHPVPQSMDKNASLLDRSVQTYLLMSRELALCQCRCLLDSRTSAQQHEETDRRALPGLGCEEFGGSRAAGGVIEQLAVITKPNELPLLCWLFCEYPLSRVSGASHRLFQAAARAGAAQQTPDCQRREWRHVTEQEAGMTILNR